MPNKKAEVNEVSEPSREPVGTSSGGVDGTVEYDKEHYPNGLNNKFMLPTAVALLEEKFENPEIRGIAACKDMIIQLMDGELIGGFTGKTILDVGSGTGFFLHPILKAVGNEGKVLATEISDTFLEHIRKAKNDKGYSDDRLEIHKCGMKDISAVGSGLCDAAMVIDVYHHLEYPSSINSEVFRILKPGGVLFLIDFYRDPPRPKEHTAEWLLAHLRAGFKVFRAEIESAGFNLRKKLDVPEMEENYLAVFQKPHKNVGGPKEEEKSAV